MADNFPDIPSKLGAPSKKSVFERQKAEAEAKKAREKAETAAVLEDFVKSFDDDGDVRSQEHAFSRNMAHSTPSAGGSIGPGKRHFTSSGMKSGPGSLGSMGSAPKSGPGSLGSSQPSHGRRRPYEDNKGQWRDRDTMFSYQDDRQTASASSFGIEDDEDRKDPSETKAAAKPTLHLSSLPPGTSPAVVKALLIPSPLVVEDVRIISPSAPPPLNAPTAERRSHSAIVTLAPETPATDIDTVVSHLQNKYLGFGYNLTISRHLSSAVQSGAAAIANPGSYMNNLPFGARRVPQITSLSRAPPPGQMPGRFAPPVSYNSPNPYDARSSMSANQVTVQAPTDLKQLRLIHKTLENLLTYGPEFEAIIMAHPQIQCDERWAWLWNSRSVSGVYYRWRLWDILTNSSVRRRGRNGYALTKPGETVFESQSVWLPPEQALKFEYITDLEEFISDEDYDSSDEEDDDGGIARRYNDHNMTGAPPPDSAPDGNDGTGYLNPLAKAKLVHLLARLPDSNSKLRRGDVARVTGFAIEHAGSGADEVADMITMNVVKPFSAIRARNRDEEESDGSVEKAKETTDTTAASLVGLYAISDILSSSASAGVRHAWRYRAIFEATLRRQRVFERLGRIDKDLGWGKLKAEKWKRSVQSMLTLWEGWCVFPQASHDEFVQSFLNPPMSEKEKAVLELEEKRKTDEELRLAKSSISKWRTVEESRALQDVAMKDVDGKLMVDDDNFDGQPMDDEMTDEDVDGVPMSDSSDQELHVEEHVEVRKASEGDSGHLIKLLPQKSENPPVTRKRPRAVDMFAEDESEGE